MHSSARHLYAHIDEKFSKTGYLKSLEGVKKFLVQEGLVREEDCKCIAEKDPKFDSTYACDKVKVSDMLSSFKFQATIIILFVKLNSSIFSNLS